MKLKRYNYKYLKRIEITLNDFCYYKNYDRTYGFYNKLEYKYNEFKTYDDFKKAVMEYIKKYNSQPKILKAGEYTTIDNRIVVIHNIEDLKYTFPVKASIKKKGKKDSWGYQIYTIYGKASTHKKTCDDIRL